VLNFKKTLRERTMENEFYTKAKVIDYVWQHSKYHGNMLAYCEKIAEGEYGNGFAALIFLFNLTENIFKDRVKDYDGRLTDVIKSLRDQGLITQKEYHFLNDKNNSIRKLRNLLAHANLSKYNLSFIEDGKEILYPLTENETCLKIYEMVSEVLYNLMLRLVRMDFVDQINLDEEINNIEINIKELTPEKLLEYKGIDASAIPNWSDLSETDRYRLAENESNVIVLTEIFKGLFK
jgi:hypothetical protein